MQGTAQKIATRMEGLPPGSRRREVMDVARRFKSAWVELAKALVEVKREELWQAWGYSSFDSYCGKELFLRKATVEKLLLSFGFLERNEPALTQPRAAPAPAFEVIEVLSRAEAQGRLPREGYQEIREEILDGPSSAGSVNRWLTERYGPAPREVPTGESVPPGERLRKLAGMAERVAEGCRGLRSVPRAVSERAQALAEDLRGLLENPK
jgi:hypothetical protein